MAPCTLTGRNGHVQGSCYYWQIQAAVNTSGASKPPPAGGSGAACSRGCRQVPDAARGWSSGFMHGLDFSDEVSQLGPRFEQPFGAGST